MKDIRVAIGLSRCSGMFRIPEKYEIKAHEYQTPTMRGVIWETKRDDVKQARKRIMQDQRRYSRGR